MILKALYDYYHRCEGLPALGMEEKQIGFVVVIDKDGQFLRLEDCRIDKDMAQTFLVKKSVGKASAPVANYLYDNSAYVLGFSLKDNGKDSMYYETFKAKVNSIADAFPDNEDMKSVKAFYEHTPEEILSSLENDSLWEEVKKNLSKKYSLFSFRINGDTKIVAEKREILQLDSENESDTSQRLCLVTGGKGETVETTTATMIQGSQPTAKLVSFQVKSGYDSYGKEKGNNAPISKEAEFAYTTALNTMLAKNSHNKFVVGGRTFLFWSSSTNEACKQAEESVYALFGFTEQDSDNPNAGVEQVRKVFNAIYSGQLKSTSEDRFYILGLAPNSARIAVVFWSETTLKDFAGKIRKHFEDMEIVDARKEKKPYMGLYEMLTAVTLNGIREKIIPNLPEQVIESIFQGKPYPYSLFSACIRRIKAEISGENNPVRIARAAIIKAYLNRLNNNNIKIGTMLDKENSNQGYLCGRLFAVLDKIQYAANGQNSIRSSYMNAASATPAVVFGRIMSLSNAHIKKLSNDKPYLAHYFEVMKGEIIQQLTAKGFPAHLNLEDQGRFFVGYYHQMNHKEENNNNE